MRPKKHSAAAGGGGFRLSSLLPGGHSHSSRNLADPPMSLPADAGIDRGCGAYEDPACQLLSVRKRSSSDSAPPGGAGAEPPPTEGHAKPKGKSGKSSSSLFRFFNRSATLLFQHPTGGHGGAAGANGGGSGSRRPYKGVTSASTKDLRSSNHPILGTAGGGGNARRQQQQHRRGLSASSSSSLSSSVMHHHLENVVHPAGEPAAAAATDLRSLPHPLLFRQQPPSSSRSMHRSSEERSDSLPAGAATSSSTSGVETASSSEEASCRGSQPPASSSSSNSVISSDYDSGAFSRTSTPDMGHHFQRLQQQIAALTGGASKSSLALAEASPLHAPKLVIDACRRTGSTHHLACVDEMEREQLQQKQQARRKSEDSAVDPRLILDCLTAASHSSSFAGGVSLTHTTSQQEAHAHSLPARPGALLSPNSGPNSDVSITIGTNTKLTITPTASRGARLSDQSPRRSRSGLPVLGTAGLTSPHHKGKGHAVRSPSTASRSRISTVYLSRDRSLPRSLHGTAVARSESSVTLFGAAPPASEPPSCCSERVTVNGQHYHCDPPAGLHAPSCPKSPPGTQPSSLINI